VHKSTVAITATTNSLRSACTAPQSEVTYDFIVVVVVIVAAATSIVETVKLEST